MAASVARTGEVNGPFGITEFSTHGAGRSAGWPQPRASVTASTRWDSADGSHGVAALPETAAAAA